MANHSRTLRKVTLLGAFEIQATETHAVRDGLILGSRREKRGFVLETGRESIEQIVALQHQAQRPLRPRPRRLVASVGAALEALGCELMRVELLAMPIPDAEAEDGYGDYVQGQLIYRRYDERRSRKLALTATEAIQLAIADSLPMHADTKLLTLNVSHFLEEIDTFSAQHQQEAKQFRSFVDGVTATDFARFYEAHQDHETPDEDA